MNEPFSVTTGMVVFFLWQAVQGLLLLILSWGTRAASRALERTSQSLANIRGELAELNTHFASLETWRQEHDKRDDERFGEHSRRLELIEGRIGRGRA